MSKNPTVNGHLKDRKWPIELVKKTERVLERRQKGVSNNNKKKIDMSS